MNKSQKASQPRACSLVELQRTFQSALLYQRDDPPLFIANAGSGSAAQRFGVYAEAYRLRLIEALAADYPAVKQWLGDDGFDALGRAYADAYPSGHFSIRWFGRHLPGFMVQSPPYDTQPAVNELAAFEWALSEAFDAAGSPTIGYDQLAALEPECWPALTLRFHPSLRRVDLNYNTPGRWQALNQKEPPPDLEAHSEAQTWIIWRCELRLLFRALPEPEAWSMEAFRQGRCFAEVCEGLCGWLDETQVALSAAGYLRAWLGEGWIAEVLDGTQDKAGSARLSRR